jgi:PKD repeat protein
MKRPTFDSYVARWSRRLSTALLAAVFLGIAGFPAGWNLSVAVGEVPWTGQPAVVETLADILSREPRNDHGHGKSETHRRHGHGKSDGGLDAGPEDPDVLLPNPNAPVVPQWPVNSGGDGEPVPDVPQAVGVNFQGVQASETTFIPPDSMGAVGPSQVMVIVNGRIKLFSKTGTALFSTSTDNFFDSVRSAGTSDPHVRYDRLSQRWYVTMIDVTNTENRVLIAVSSDSVISSFTAFSFFQFQHDLPGTTPNSDTGHFADYDMLGVDRLALYIGANIFGASTGGGVIGTTAYVVNKSNLLSGTLTVTAFRQIGAVSGTGPGPWSPQGVDNDDPAATEGYFIGVDRNLSGVLYIRRISDPGGSPSISDNLTVTVPATSAPIPQPSKGATKNLDALGTRLFAAAIHRNKIDGTTSLWTAHNIQVDNTGVATSSGGRNGSRWYEIGNLTTTPTLIEAGTLFDSATTNPRGFWIPSVAASGQGHMALGCSYAGSNDFAGVAVAGRLRTDPLGATQAPTLAVFGPAAYNLSETPDPHRWGDYSQTVVDPTDDMTMWTFQEYCNAPSSWAVRAIQLRPPRPAYPISAVPASLLQGQTNIDVVVTGVSASGSGYFDPGPDPGGPGYLNHISAFITSDVTVNKVTFSNPTNITLNVSVASDAALGPRAISVTNPDKQFTNSASGILTILAGPPVVDFTAGPLSGLAPLTVYFTNLVSGAADYMWDFGDGSSSTNISPSNVYTNAGNYSVTLVAVGPGGTNSVTKTNFVTVTNLPPPVVVVNGSDGTNFIFSFSTVPGKTYVVQYKDLLSDPVWQTLGSVPGDGTLQTVTNSLTVPQRFYRLNVQ